MSHDVMCVISGGIYSGLYLGSGSLDMSQGHTSMLTLFDGITRSAIAVDLHFFTSSYNGSIRCLLPQGLAVLFHHSFVDIYSHIVSSLSALQNLHIRPAFYLYYSMEWAARTGLSTATQKAVLRGVL